MKLTGTDILYLLAGGPAVATVMMWWFKTELPVHVFGILRTLGWRRRPDFWPQDFPAVPITRSEWEIWINTACPTLGELLTCPGCFSFHASYLMAVLLWGCLHPAWPMVVVGVLTWPYLANRMLKAL
jgi:hypothetical protein